MKSKVLFLGLVWYAFSAFTSVQARPVEVCFNTLTVYQSQDDFGDHEEWLLRFSILQPWGEERLGKIEKKVPEKLSNARWSTSINRCYRTDIDWNYGVVAKISGVEKDAPGDDRLPTATKELNFGYRNMAYASGYGHAYSVSISLRQLY